jgi:serine protease Do
LSFVKFVKFVVFLSLPVFAQMVKPDVNVALKLGILGLELDSKILAMIPPLRKPAGVLVAARIAGFSPPEGGLLQGDLITSMNGEAVTGLAGLRAALDKLKQDEAVVFQVQRLGRLMFVAFNLE